MDSIKAALLAETVVGKKVGRWTALSLINNGKSAAVFKATDGKTEAALKIFDDELITRFGDTTQLARIDRELGLIGKHHPNMVKILDGGLDAVSNNHFIVMEYLHGPNVKQCLKDIPEGRIPVLVEQLASAARFLESLELCHRDIKPENIILLDDFSCLKLLDFGVIRPIGKPGLTDQAELHHFIGTLQYSSPEFLLREEEDTMLGWRALTFYQIGGVIHDMVMRKEMFHEFAVPYSKMVNAVQHIVPDIQSANVDKRLVHLARCCLVKDANSRVELLNWDSFVFKTDRPSLKDIKMRVVNRGMLAKAESVTSLAKAHPRDDRLISDVINLLKIVVRSTANESDAFPNIKTVIRVKDNPILKVVLNSSEEHSLSEALTLILRVKVISSEVQAITITGSACLGDVPTSAPPYSECFKGLYDVSQISEGVSDFMYYMVDQAQQSTHAGWLESGLGEKD